ncbi:hypothetical protein Q7P37_010787 [Cladosporium fusiforme]
MAGVEIAPDPSPSLLSLPAELRNTIYDHVLPSTLATFGDAPHQAPALLQTNHQLRTEFSGVFYSSDNLKIDAYYTSTDAWCPLTDSRAKRVVLESEGIEFKDLVDFWSLASARSQYLSHPKFNQANYQQRLKVGMATGDTPDPAAPATPSAEAPVMRSVEKLLLGYNREEILGLQGRLANTCMRRCSVLNQQASPLLKLPPELLLEIGLLVLGIRGSDVDNLDLMQFERCLEDWDKDWFERALPLLQTCKQLRSQLQPLCFESMPCNIPEDTFCDYPRERGVLLGVRDSCLEQLTRGARKAHHTRALAGGLECMIFGKLMHPPVMYVQCKALDPTWDGKVKEVQSRGREWPICYVEVSHGRAKNMRGHTHPFVLGTLSTGEATAIWEMSRAHGLASS